jgi:hypothetical protein
MEAVWWFVNDDSMNLPRASLRDDYTVSQYGGVGDQCWRISGTRPEVSMSEAIRRMRIVYLRAHRTMDVHLLPGYLDSIGRRAA